MQHGAVLRLAEVVEREDRPTARALGNRIAEVRQKGMLDLKNVDRAGADQVAQLDLQGARGVGPGDKRPTLQQVSQKIARALDFGAGTHDRPLDPLAKWRQLGHMPGFIGRFQHGKEQDAVSSSHLTNEVEVADGIPAVRGPGQAIGQPQNCLALLLTFSVSGHVHSQLCLGALSALVCDGRRGAAQAQRPLRWRRARRQ